MAALLVTFATHDEYRKLVQREFDGLKALRSQYLEALGKAYPQPVVKEP